MTRDQARQLLTEFTQSESLRKHALAVEAAMRHYAARFGENVELWGVVGLIHDFDYEQHPTMEEHVWAGMKILRAYNVYEKEIRAGIELVTQSIAA